MPRDELDEILAALDVPPHALERWLDDLDGFCRAHGGDRHYRELRALLAECRARVEKQR
jgi:hypothetical protein